MGLRGPGVGAYGGGEGAGSWVVGVPPGGPFLSSRNVAFVVTHASEMK